MSIEERLGNTLCLLRTPPSYKSYISKKEREETANLLIELAQKSGISHPNLIDQMTISTREEELIGELLEKTATTFNRVLSLKIIEKVEEQLAWPDLEEKERNRDVDPTTWVDVECNIDKIPDFISNESLYVKK